MKPPGSWVTGGVRAGFRNEADDLHGVRIGIVNFDNRGRIKFFPFVNIGW